MANVLHTLMKYLRMFVISSLIIHLLNSNIDLNTRLSKILNTEIMQ